MNFTKKHRILVVDDEQDVTELLKYKFEEEGYDCVALNNPLAFVSYVQEINPNLIILDINMPDLSGLQLCGIVRHDPKMMHIPIILLTAHNETEVRVDGLERGADDFIAKPFSFVELMLRVKNLLNPRDKIAHAAPHKRIEVGKVVIDSESHQLEIDNKQVDLTATEFRLLKHLMEGKGRIQSRENLLLSVWHYDSDMKTRTLDTHIRRLREKLGSHANMIETVRGFGYRFVEN